MTKEYFVRMPFAGVINAVVEAESEEDAIEKALESELQIDLKEHGTNNGAEVEEWELYKRTVQGNANYTPLWEAEAEEH